VKNKKDIDRKELARRCLKGLSIGDAFGESFFGSYTEIQQHLTNRTIPKTSWEFTDDTVMAIAVYNSLEDGKKIDQNQLLAQFIRNHNVDPNRGYGATLRRLLREVEEGKDWKIVSKSVFDGMGSMGNGAAMRAAPIGAFHYNDLQLVIDKTIRVSEVTHSNIEAISGAIAVSIATAIATKNKLEEVTISANSFIQLVCEHLPNSDTKSKIEKAASLGPNFSVESLSTILGNGSKMLSQDTVPFCIWCAAHNQHHFEDALWKAVSILGDRDTICAIVGAITVMSASTNTIPVNWANSVEKFETSEFLKS
jgi:ADP-ribosylglycohydrolase